MPRELLRIYKIQRGVTSEDVYERPSQRFLPPEGAGRWKQISNSRMFYWWINSVGDTEVEELTFIIVDKNIGAVTGLPDREGTWYMRLIGSSSEETSDTIFEFHINPNRIEIQETKAKNRIRTRRGYEFQHWGNEPTVINITGRTGGLGKVTENGKTYDVPVEETTAYQALKILEDVYLEDQRLTAGNTPSDYLLAISYRGDVYVGHFDTFTFTEDAEQPYIFDYTIRFTAEFKESSITGARKSLAAADMAQRNTLQQLEATTLR